MEVAAAPPPFHEDEDDDDMADLFSFGVSDVSAADLVPDTAAAAVTVSPDSPDSFLELLTAETNSILPGDGKGAGDDAEALEILQWLDNDEENPTEEIVFTPSSSPPPPPAPTVVAIIPPSYDTFTAAMESSDATKEQIRALFEKEQAAHSEASILDSSTQRVELYCRMICNNKTLEQTEASSLADSFVAWKKERETNNSTASMYSHLGTRIAVLAGKSADQCTQELDDLISYYQQQQNQHDAEPDVLLPPIAAAILSTGISVTAAAVVLSQLIPNYMPLLALPADTERWEAALSLHSEFYLLASYHIPLLVVHLDRHLPGWQWPKLPPSVLSSKEESSAVAMARNLTQHGHIPPSWLLTDLAGDTTLLPPTTILRLWDGILTSQNKAMRFFLTLSVLERVSPRLLLLTGPELLAALEKVWTLEDIDIEEPEGPERKEWLSQWWSYATVLEDATPRSALARLQQAEDVAVQTAVVLRQKRAEEALQARLEAEAAAHREAQERKAEEARQRLSRARLVAFYRKHAPSKESNVEKIMETYDGRLDVLDAKLRSKYGEGFNPAMKPKPVQPKPDPKQMLANMRNKSFMRKPSESENSVTEERKANVVSLSVTSEEVLPVICWSKEEARQDRRRMTTDATDRRPLKYYLVDGRSEQAVAEQGRFPTAVSLSPEALMDPERMQQVEDMFESLRGACHIAIMGEGFSALPRLYNQKLSPKLTELMEQDESRTNMCALFFQKRGFCFVSVLDGGFCAAHSWLSREGPSKHLSPSTVLIDYNAEASLFGQLERLHTASATEKAQRKMANLLESSLVTMTKKASQIERLAMGIEGSRRQGGLRINNLFGRADSSDVGDAASEDQKPQPQQPFTNPFKREEQAPSEAPIPESSSFDGNTRSPSEVGIALGKWGGGLGAAAKAKWGQFRRNKGPEQPKNESSNGSARFEKV